METGITRLRPGEAIEQVIFERSHSCFGAVETYDGGEPSFWRNRAIIVACVKSVRTDASTDIREVGMDVLEAGMTESLVPTKLNVEYERRRNSALIKFDPEPGDVFLLCIEQDGAKTHWRIPSFFFQGFGSDSAARRVNGIDDPAIEKALTKIAKARAGYRLKNSNRQEN